MKKYKIKTLLITVLTTTLCACSGFFDKDNTPSPAPLAKFTPEAKVQSVWYNSPNSGAGDEYVKLVPAVSGNVIFTADKNGVVTATDKTCGKTLWKSRACAVVTGGPAANEGIVVVGGREGEVVALRQTDGQQIWKTTASSEILASPTVGRGVVLVKPIDGQLTALSATDGHLLWRYQQTEPALILRGGSTPRIYNDSAFVGFENGNLARLGLREGNPVWQQMVGIPEGSFAIQRMVDIDADPIVVNGHVYAATYQGRVAALEMSSGEAIWTHDISSYIGIAADSEQVYVSDAKSHIWAFNIHSGNVNWRQLDLQFRNITGPAVMGNYIVVGDGEGYLHWLSKQDGHFIARTRVGGGGMLAAPVVDNNVVYTLTTKGQLAAYTLSCLS